MTKFNSFLLNVYDNHIAPFVRTLGMAIGLVFLATAGAAIGVLALILGQNNPFIRQSADIWELILEELADK